MLGKLPVLGFIKRALEIINLGADMDAAGERSAIAAGFLQGGEFRQATEREVDFGHGAHRAVMLQLDDEVGRQVYRIYQLEKRASRIGVGNDRLSRNFLATAEND